MIYLIHYLGGCYNDDKCLFDMPGYSNTIIFEDLIED